MAIIKSRVATNASKNLYLFLGAFVFLSSTHLAAETALSLNEAIRVAQQNDPWIHGNKLKQKAVEMRSIASSSLPDPTVSVGLMNLPTDGFSFDQENMTQLKVGVSQMFPRGDSLALKQQQLKIESTSFPLMRENRLAQLKTQVSQVWLDAYLAQQTIALIKSDWALFEQMAEVAKASYSNAVGQTRQQDVIRAQLEIVQLEDRLAEQQQYYDTAMAKLDEWMYRYNPQSNIDMFIADGTQSKLKISKQLPDIPLVTAKPETIPREQIVEKLLNHPAIRAIGVKQNASQKGVEIAKQSYKPQWGVNASYAYRDDMPSGMSRADFFSVGVSFDLPLFTENRQDKQVAASVAEAEAVRTDKLLALKQMLSSLEKELAQLARLRERQLIYRDKLLTQTNEQAEASLTAYTNDDGDFAEVVRARIAELNARIAAMKLDVEALKTIARINYYFTGSETNSMNLHHGEGEEI